MTTEQMDAVDAASTKAGVWVVYSIGSAFDAARLERVFSGDQELEARRFSDAQGYGEVAFIEYDTEVDL